ncbi:MAG: MFS transporter [Desulfobacteraceae bacterium]|nr:MAG: MFS transporter [Desulfobacteraceae bacterium]
MPDTKNNPKTIFGWCMYDWANSAYTTTVLVALLPMYFADGIVGPQGVKIGNTLFSATTLWGYTVSLASLLIFLIAPFLGAIADFSAAKKKFLFAFAYNGALFTVLLFFCQTGDVFKTLLFFLIAQIGFIGANVFYDAFLPQITTEDKMDKISGKGFAFGYAGGGLQFAISLGLVAGHSFLGISLTLAVRLSIILAGLWWAGFSLFTLKYLVETPRRETLPKAFRKYPGLLAYAAIGFSRTWKTARNVTRFRHLLLFLIAFMFYDDGIQTVITMATMYGTDELHLSKTYLMVTLLIIQFISIGGALLFSRLAGKIGAKKAVMLTLVLWSGVVIYAYFITSVVEYLILGVVVGLAMGGSQALSRSLYGSMVPEEASAEFFGFYTVFSKFSAIWGPLVFAVIRQLTGSSRLSILSLIGFFIIGLILLSFVNVEKARQAKQSGAF